MADEKNQTSEEELEAKEPELEERAETVSEVDTTEPDPEPEADTSETGERQVEQPVVRKGGAVAWIALVLALLVGGGVGYLYYALVHLDPGAELRAELASQRQMTSSLNSEVGQQLAE